MSRTSSVLMAFVALCLTGCVCSSAERAWVRANGGRLTGSRQQRLERLATRLSDTAVGQRVGVSVLDNDDLAAFSWRSGHVFVARGLLDALDDDDELLAVLAHELGHLINDGSTHPVASLEGHTANPGADVEHDADLVGLRLLRQHGLSARPMVSMLRKVRRDPHLSAAAQEALQRRIALLETAR